MYCLGISAVQVLSVESHAAEVGACQGSKYIVTYVWVHQKHAAHRLQGMMEHCLLASLRNIFPRLRLHSRCHF